MVPQSKLWFLGFFSLYLLPGIDIMCPLRCKAQNATPVPSTAHVLDKRCRTHCGCSFSTLRKHFPQVCSQTLLWISMAWWGHVPIYQAAWPRPGAASLLNMQFVYRRGLGEQHSRVLPEMREGTASCRVDSVNVHMWYCCPVGWGRSRHRWLSQELLLRFIICSFKLLNQVQPEWLYDLTF